MRLEAAEQLLVLELLVGEAHQRLERDLVAEPVVAADLEDLGADEALDQRRTCWRRCGPAPARSRRCSSGVRNGSSATLRQAVGQELLGEVEAAAADDVAVDVPADALGGLDALG